jgi:phosphate transport system permease protein
VLDGNSNSADSAEQPRVPSEGAPKSARRPKRTTRRSVLVADFIANWTITIGGLGVIVAVFGIMVFLAQVVWPLFAGSQVLQQGRATLEGASADVLMELSDEYRTIVVAVQRDGEVGINHRASGRRINSVRFPIGERKITAFARTLNGHDVAIGFDDGSLRLGKINIEVAVLAASDDKVGLRALAGGDRTDGEAIYSSIEGEQIRRISVSVALEEPQQIAPQGVPLVALDLRLGGAVERPTRSFVSVDAQGAVRLSRSEMNRSLLGGTAGTARVESSVLPPLPAGTAVASLLLTGLADQVYVVDRAGTVFRYDTRDPQKASLAERTRLTAAGVTVTTLGFLVGEQSIVVGGSDGSVNVFFRLQRPRVATTDGFVLVKAHELEAQSAAIRAFAASPQSKSFATADANGQVWVRHATSRQTLLKLSTQGSPLTAVAITPREDGVLAISASHTLWDWRIHMPHPETTLASIFGRVWYEGYPEPEHTWQSSSGTDAFEPKFSLVPLIFGTIKASLYTLLFAIPIALCGAIYTSEFLGPRVRNVVKPTMEMMASLPSVVLGFIAALILAPIVESWIGAIVLAFVVVPLCVLLGAYLWQWVPQQVVVRVGGSGRLVLVGAALICGVALAIGLAPAFERWFFAGSFKAWTGGDVGSSRPIMSLLLWPFAFVLLALAEARGMLPRIASGSASSDGPRPALLRWLASLVASLALAWLLATALLAIGWDVRGGVVDNYVQRNTFIVGFVMGFAVIPIMYTIAEDALRAVPEHLRAASLACGATPWQTSVRVVLPTALSGIFAAVMVRQGSGRDDDRRDGRRQYPGDGLEHI